MDVKAKQTLLLKKLKQQIKKLQKKEALGRAKMRAAFKKVNKLGDDYKIRLTRKMHEMEQKLAQTEAACYIKIAADIENQLVKGIKKKVKALTRAAKRAKRSSK